MSIYNNYVFLKGNLGKPAEVVETKAGHVAKFSLAVYRNGKGTEAVTDWVNCVAWHDIARGMQLMDKGTKLIVIGSIANRSYEAKDGTTKYVTEVNVREIAEDIAVAKDNDNESEPF